MGIFPFAASLSIFRVHGRNFLSGLGGLLFTFTGGLRSYVLLGITTVSRNSTLTLKNAASNSEDVKLTFLSPVNILVTNSLLSPVPLLISFREYFFPFTFIGGTPAFQSHPLLCRLFGSGCVGSSVPTCSVDCTPSVIRDLALLASPILIAVTLFLDLYAPLSILSIITCLPVNASNFDRLQD